MGCKKLAELYQSATSTRSSSSPWRHRVLTLKGQGLIRQRQERLHRKAKGMGKEPGLSMSKSLGVGNFLQAGTLQSHIFSESKRDVASRTWLLQTLHFGSMSSI